MREDAVPLEEERLKDVHDFEDYPNVHERHRIFPIVFEERQHKKIIDLSAGVGCAAKNIQENYPSQLICNDITPTCLRILNKLGLVSVSFDIDEEKYAFPFPDGYFDAVISLATIEHLVHTEEFLKECCRILSDNGYLYISTPNYASIIYFPRFVLAGKTFNDPLSKDSRIRYEFYAHVRSFTYNTLLEYVSAYGFVPDTVYLPLPESSTRYKKLYSASKPKALAYRYSMWLMYRVLSPRWASEPVLCFRKASNSKNYHPRKVIL